MTRIVWAGGPHRTHVSDEVVLARQQRRRGRSPRPEDGDLRSALRALVVVAVLAAVALVGVSFRVSEVRVNGAVVADLERVREVLAPVLGERLLLVDTRPLRHRLEEDAWIRSASISRVLPGRLEVDLAEGQPLYRLPEERGLVDDEGRLLPVPGEVEAGALPLLSGVAWTDDGTGLDELSVARVRELSRALRRVPWTWSAGLAHVRLAGGDGVELTAADGLQLVLGETDFERRLSRFTAVRPRLRAGEAGRVDLRFERRVVLAPAGARNEPTGG